jgi:YcaO-like protein with predicted kinase domain
MGWRVMPGVYDAGIKEYQHGTHRAVPPAVTLERLGRLLAPMGITRVANITGLDHVGVPVVIACRPNSRSLSVSQGKGIELQAAKASAIMESVEQYHAERITLPLRLGSYNELRHICQTVPGESLPCSTVSRYSSSFRLLWIEGYDLANQRGVLVPYELVHLNFTLPLPEGSGCFPLSSNGLASGNHLLEAVLHGTCEVIERDATTIWMLGDADDKAATRVDLASIDHPSCCAVLDQFESANLLVAVWDMTSDVGVPTFRCTIADRVTNPFRPVYPATGTGCHSSRDVALLRALTEAAQGRLTIIAGSRDDIPRADYELARSPEVLDRLREALLAERPQRLYTQVVTSSGATFEDDVAWVTDRLRHVGLTTLIAVDLSIPRLGLSVVRVIVPGLEQQRLGVDYLPGPRARARMRAPRSSPS